MTLKNNIRCKKLATVVSGRKNVARPFVRRKQISTSVEMARCCYISALKLTCFHLTKARATYFRPETIIASFLKLMGIIIQSVIQSFLKTPLCSASLT